MKNEKLYTLAEIAATHYDCNGDGSKETCSTWCHYSDEIERLYTCLEMAFNMGKAHVLDKLKVQL